jgi:ATP-dependent DNA helicase RecG
LHLLDTPIEFLKGVGPAKSELLKKELQIFTFRDLLHLFPFRYVDRSRFYKIRDIKSADTEIQLVGRITRLEEIAGKGRSKRLRAQFVDDTGSVELVWFRGAKWIKSSLKANQDYVLFAKPNVYQGKFSFPHPELELAEEFKKSPLKGLQPVYPSTEKLNNKGLNSRGIGKLTRNLIPQIKNQIPEFLPPGIIEVYQLHRLEDAYIQVHFPANVDILDSARRRLKFNEFFFMQMEVLQQKQLHNREYRGFVFEKVGDNFNHFFERILPFELTGAQKRVIKEVRRDLKSGRHMNRLVQGDVGSGKTMVALMSMLIALDNGFQACMMAPTEILATQHYNGIKELLQQMPINVELLTGSVKGADRKEIHKNLLDGSLHILIGTHALIEPTVKFKNLGLAVVDEQHRFGVAQRAKLWKKNTLPPHVLVMTATPIPRTLAMSMYGNLDMSVIDEMPPGRKPVKTLHQYDQNRLKVFGFLKEQIAAGRQVYIVYPLIEESEKLDLKDLMEGYESIVRAFPKPKYQVSVVHGRMKATDKDYEMQRFVEGKTQIMVATTVIEVGVNVPNASVMVIENANRFGLSQLHQLRGRVGRGADQSYCILMSDYKLSNEAKTRLGTMVKTNDGFEIAEVDMQLRGPGDIMGTRQSGLLDLKIASLAKDGAVLAQARKAVIDLLESDPGMEKPENQALRAAFQKRMGKKVQWGRIS